MPKISVILPVYNGEAYLPLAIDSVLAQTYTDFELIIINDASTDATEFIIQKYQAADPRIVYHKNETNLKVVGSLNKGISLSKGEYIARMDADDFSLPTRFEKQVSYLDTHPEISMVDVLMTYFDENGEMLNQTNARIFSPADIKKALPKNNPLGHSSIMIKGGILRDYAYRNTNFEDYELWLRLIAGGHAIAKIEAPLLLYRIHKQSITSKAVSDKSHFLKQAKAKFKFLSYALGQKGRWSWFHTRVCFYMLRDYLLYIYKKIKN